MNGDSSGTGLVAEPDLESLRQDVERLWSPRPTRELRYSEAKYRALVEGSFDFIYVLDAEGRFTFANCEAERLLGYTPQELLGRHFTDLLPPEDQEAARRAFHERRTGSRATRRHEIRLLTKAGKSLDVELDTRRFALSASGLYDEQTFLGTHGVARDITERKHQETRQQALQQVRDAVWGMVGVGDVSRVLAAVHGSLTTMRIPFGAYGVQVVDEGDPPSMGLYMREDSGDVSCRNECIVTDPEGYAAAIMAVWQAGEPVYCADLHRQPSHHVRAELESWFGPSRSVMDAPFSQGVLTVTHAEAGVYGDDDLDFVGELAKVLSEAFHRVDDLQQLTASAKRYRTLIETPHLVVALLDAQGNFLYISPQVQRWLGYAPADFYYDASMAERLVLTEDVAAYRMLFAAPAPGEPRREAECRWRTRTGEIRWASLSVFPIFEQPGDEALHRVSTYQMVIQDITERRQIEEVVRASLREKEVMLKEIHHRVRNNLQVVSSLLRLQSADLENEAVREVFANSQRRIASMALIHEALYNSSDLARIDFEPYVTALVANLVDSFGAGTARIDMQVRVQAAPLSLDRALPMGLIVSELVSNALRHAFADRSAGRIAIELTDASQGDGFTLSVSDDGVGLPASVDAWESPGLGLRLVEALAGQLRARLHIDRARGTTFTLTRS